MKFLNSDSGMWHLAGPAAAVIVELKKVRPETEKKLRDIYAAVGVLTTYPPTAGVVVENRYPGTCREHLVVSPCRLVAA